MRLACFVSPHGFGHAARASAVMEAVRSRVPDCTFEIFTTVPAWFFSDSLGGGFRHHPVLTDIGLAQRTSLHEDLAETVRRLDRFLPFDGAAVAELAALMRALGCAGVLADISPLGLAVARRAGLPSVLVENFIWDFIYDGYLGAEPGLERAAAAMRELFTLATRHVRTEPVCGSARADLTVAPVSRRPRQPRGAVRAALGLPERAPVVLLTMGGIRWAAPQDSAPFRRHPAVRFVIPGGEGVFAPAENLVLLPHHSTVYHPDLVAASDAVVGKVGYSTVAEVYRAGVPFGHVARESFPESPHLVAFISREMAGLPIPAHELEGGAWVDRVEELLSLEPRRSQPRDGAAAAADFIRAAFEM